jgi:hypothetical protein
LVLNPVTQFAILQITVSVGVAQPFVVATFALLGHAVQVWFIPVPVTWNPGRATKVVGVVMLPHWHWAVLGELVST